MAFLTNVWGLVKKPVDIVRQRFKRRPAADTRELVQLAELSVPSVAPDAPPPPHQAPEPPPPPTNEQLLAEKGLQLLRPIGSGAFGEVWIAKKTKERRYVAVKVVEWNAANPDAYERELAAVQCLRAHGLTAECFMQVQAPLVFNHQFFAYEMPLADDANGRFGVTDDDSDGYEPLTLSRKLRDAGPLSVNDCIEIGLSIIKGVEQLHMKNLIHRDIKPSNIIYVSCKPLLADVGLIATPDPSRSQPGTPGYRPPQGPGKPRADIYAIGKLLYHMATGFPVDDGLKMPEYVSNPYLFRRLRHVCMIASDNKEDLRYIDTKAFRAALENVMSPEPSLPDEVSTLRWLKLAALDRKNRHRSDPPDLHKYKSAMRRLIDESAAKARKELDVANLEVDKFVEVTGDVTHEFERRLGFQPERILEVCNLAHYRISQRGDSVMDRLIHRGMELARKHDAISRRRERRAMACLIEGVEYALDELWAQQRDQFLAA